MSRHVTRRLAEAMAYPFGEPVTAFLTQAYIDTCCAFGVIHRHRKADRFGRFQDGHRVRTSNIVRVQLYDSFWVLRTFSGSFYVIASFDPRGGRQSLQRFLSLQKQGLHQPPAGLQ